MVDDSTAEPQRTDVPNDAVGIEEGVIVGAVEGSADGEDEN